jgi:hypothetical protein
MKIKYPLRVLQAGADRWEIPLHLTLRLIVTSVDCRMKYDEIGRVMLTFSFIPCSSAR